MKTLHSLHGPPNDVPPPLERFEATKKPEVRQVSSFHARDESRRPSRARQTTRAAWNSQVVARVCGGLLLKVTNGRGGERWHWRARQLASLLSRSLGFYRSPLTQTNSHRRQFQRWRKVFIRWKGCRILDAQKVFSTRTWLVSDCMLLTNSWSLKRNKTSIHPSIHLSIHPSHTPIK